MDRTATAEHHRLERAAKRVVRRAAEPHKRHSRDPSKTADLDKPLFIANPELREAVSSKGIGKPRGEGKTGRWSRKQHAVLAARMARKSKGY